MQLRPQSSYTQPHRKIGNRIPSASICCYASFPSYLLVSPPTSIVSSPSIDCTDFSRLYPFTTTPIQFYDRGLHIESLFRLLRWQTLPDLHVNWSTNRNPFRITPFAVSNRNERRKRFVGYCSRFGFWYRSYTCLYGIRLHLGSSSWTAHNEHRERKTSWWDARGTSDFI